MFVLKVLRTEILSDETVYTVQHDTVHLKMGNTLSCCIPPGVSESKTSERTRRSIENGKGGFDVRDEPNIRSDVTVNKHYSRTNSHNFHDANGFVHYPSTKNSESVSNIQHISEREPEDGINDPSINPRRGPLFMVRSKSELREGRERKRRSQYNGMENQGIVLYSAMKSSSVINVSPFLGTPSDVPAVGSGGLIRKFNSCSTIYVDDSTVSQPNLRNTIKCVSLAIFYHIKNREEKEVRTIDIFDEKLHPLSKDELSFDYDRVDPEHRHIYRFLRTLFSAAQLTAECAIVTLVYLVI